MASLYRDPRSPFWFLKFKSPEGKWRCRSLRPLRHGIPTDTRKARAACDAQSLEEHTRSPQRDAWLTWVPDYLRTRYAKNADTQRRAENAWQRMSEYLRERKIQAPQDLTYRECAEYPTWRKGRGAAHNTALLELKILGVICDEAVRRGIIAKNPASKLGIGRERGKEKAELSDDDIATIRAAFISEKAPAWMSHAFEIAIHHGCRLTETALFRDDVELERGQLHFRKTKGDKPFSVPVHPALKPLLQKLLGTLSDSPRIFELPANAARDFHRFFKKLGLGVTFHSTRVTVASRLARNGYPVSKAMRLLNHGSELVHRQYQRLQPQDVADAYAVLRIPEREGGNPSSENQGSPEAT